MMYTYIFCKYIMLGTYNQCIHTDTFIWVYTDTDIQRFI